MRHITLNLAMVISIALSIGTAAGAGLTHAAGAGHSEVRTIKTTVSRFRHEEPTAMDWYIAVDGKYAVAYDGCRPGACDENQLVRRGRNWIVTCFTTEGKGQFGTCLTPPKTEQELRRTALCMALPAVDGVRCNHGRRHGHPLPRIT